MTLKQCISRSKFSIGAQNGSRKIHLSFEVFYWSSELLSTNLSLVRSFLLELRMPFKKCISRSKFSIGARSGPQKMYLSFEVSIGAQNGSRKCISRSKFSLGAQNGSKKCISRSKFSIGAQNGFQKMYLPFEVFYWSSGWLSQNVSLVRSFLLEFRMAFAKCIPHSQFSIGTQNGSQKMYLSFEVFYWSAEWLSKMYLPFEVFYGSSEWFSKHVSLVRSFLLELRMALEKCISRSKFSIGARNGSHKLCLSFKVFYWSSEWLSKNVSPFRSFPLELGMTLKKCISRMKCSIGTQNGSRKMHLSFEVFYTKCISRSKFSIGVQNGSRKMHLSFEVFYWSSEWLSKNVSLVRSFLLELGMAFKKCISLSKFSIGARNCSQKVYLSFEVFYWSSEWVSKKCISRSKFSIGAQNGSQKMYLSFEVFSIVAQNGFQKMYLPCEVFYWSSELLSKNVALS